MGDLNRQDLRAVLGFLHDGARLLDLDAFVAYVLARLPDLVQSEATVYNEYSVRRNRIVWQQNPVDFAFAGSERIWERFASQHPILRHFGRTRDGAAVKFSDFVSQREFARTDLYNEFFRPVRVKHQMTFCVREPSGIVIAIALNRTARDFSERDRAVLNVLRLHLVGAYQNVEVVTHLSEKLARLEGAVETLDQGLVVLSRSGRVVTMTALARGWLQTYFGGDATRSKGLPAVLERWVRRHRAVVGARDSFPTPPPPLTVERDGKQLRARLIPYAGRDVILLEERHTVFDPAAFEAFAVTAREAEVLWWIMHGKTNGEIGTILGIAERTVEKHSERVLQKLGAETRTAAAALALETMQARVRAAAVS
jgi:DNA-binding CsgD family transcriptional regulator